MKPIADSTQLSIQVEGEDLVIRIGIPLLLHAISNGPLWTEGMLISDDEMFVQELVKELALDGEDGTTLIHEAFDRAALRVVENGSEAVEDVDPSDCESIDDAK